MKRIALVTDSTADFTDSLKDDCQAHIIPLKVMFGEQEYLDGDMSSEVFYERLQVEKVLPKTSQPSPEDFKSLYNRLLQEYQEIISIHISSELSGTLNSARLAAEKLKAKIHLVDSKTISLGIAMIMMEASKYVKEGLESAEIIKKLSALRTNVETIFTLDTLEYLQKGGRIGRVHGMMGQLLNIKPIIRVGDDGVYHTLGKARSQEKALKSMVESFKQLARGRKPLRFTVAHGAALQAGLYLKEAMENAFQMPASVFTQVGPVIGVHTGPGTVGAAFQYE